MIFYQRLSRNLKSLRISSSLSQASIAKVLNVTTQQYQKYESGKNKIPIYRLSLFCDLMHIDIDSIIVLDFTLGDDNCNAHNLL